MDSQEFISFLIPPVAYRLSITSSLLPVAGPYIDHSNRCVPVQQGKTTGQTRFSMTSHHPILTSFRAGWTHKRNICFLTPAVMNRGQQRHIPHPQNDPHTRLLLYNSFPTNLKEQ